MTVCFTTDRMLHFGDCDISGTAYYPAYMNMLNGGAAHEQRRDNDDTVVGEVPPRRKSIWDK